MRNVKNPKQLTLQQRVQLKLEEDEEYERLERLKQNQPKMGLEVPQFVSPIDKSMMQQPNVQVDQIDDNYEDLGQAQQHRILGNDQPIVESSNNHQNQANAASPYKQLNHFLNRLETNKQSAVFRPFNREMPQNVNYTKLLKDTRIQDDADEKMKQINSIQDARLNHSLDLINK